MNEHNCTQCCPSEHFIKIMNNHYVLLCAIVCYRTADRMLALHFAVKIYNFNLQFNFVVGYIL